MSVQIRNSTDRTANMKIENDIEITPLFNGGRTQSAREIRCASPYVEITNEPAPKLIVDAPLPDGLAQGIFWAQYRVENLRIVPVFGAGAVQTSPRVGRLHVQVDDSPWWWAEASDNNTIDIAGFNNLRRICASIPVVEN